jgi:cyclophilin family peptidyl-prolyl cis-trans isomerase
MPSDKRDRQRRNRAQKRKRQQRASRLKLIRRRLVQALWVAAGVAVIVTISNLISRSSTTSPTTTSAETMSTTEPSGPTTTADAAALGPAYEAFRAQETACGAAAPPPARTMQFDAPVDQHLDPDVPITATISTSCGDIVVALDPQLAPETVNSFVFLARQGYFDGTVFSRIVPGFVIQGGDPTATNTDGPGYTLADEYPPSGFTYDRGVVAMANAGQSGTTGSQFFVALGSSGLPTQYSPLGDVVDGDATLDAIAAVPVGPDATGAEDSHPLQTVYINSVRIDVGS